LDIDGIFQCTNNNTMLEYKLDFVMMLAANNILQLKTNHRPFVLMYLDCCGAGLKLKSLKIDALFGRPDMPSRQR
jgi:hypothetical protein